MRRKALQTVLALALIGGCGREIDSKDANSSTNTGPPLNSSSAPGRNMERGSSEAEVLAAFNRIWPLICEYDATCEEPLIQGECADGFTADDLEGDCFVVDNAKLSECEDEVRGLQCEGFWENLPDDECFAEAVRECECLDGFVDAWSSSDERGCYPPCTSSSQCSAGSACYDGACMTPQEDRCPDEQVLATVNGEEPRCYERCDDGTCDTGFVCASGVCIEEAEPEPNSGS